MRTPLYPTLHLLLTAPRGRQRRKPSLFAAIYCIWTVHPAFGSTKITQMLFRRGGVLANRKRVRLLMGLPGIALLAPGPTATKANPAFIKYPYRLRDVVVDHPNQARATDITYIPYAKGPIYLVAIIDRHSKRPLSWQPPTPWAQTSASQHSLRPWPCI